MEESEEADTKDIESFPELLGDKACIAKIWPDESKRPGIRTFLGWKAKGYIPFTKIEKLVYYDPAEVRKALDKLFAIPATYQKKD